MAESAQAVSADYQLIRSARRTVAIHIRQDGLVLVRAPLRMPTTFIDDFVQSRRDWIAKHLGDIASRKARTPEPEESAVWWHLGDALPRAGRSEAQWLVWQRAEAAAYLPARLLALAAALGPAWQPRQIKLRRMRSRWGSCSHQRDITLNTVLMHMPPAYIDYVLHHELCHLHEFNHSPAFYALQGRVCPDWALQKKALNAFAERLRPV
ncbi:MAG: YgjP-like metallopeptidase domain-containing protein [Pseudomonadota bacterium]